MTIEEAIKVIEIAQAEVEWSYPMDYAIAFDMAVSALRAQQESNTPLTLEELRGMDGEPVYMHFGDNCGEWVLVRVVRNPPNAAVFVTHRNGLHSNVKLALECGGRFYRRNPEERAPATPETVVPSWSEHLQARFLRTE